MATRDAPSAVGGGEVGPLVEAPKGVFICEQCIELCRSIMEQEKLRIAESQATVESAPPRPNSN